MEERELISSIDNLLISQICQILEGNNINYIRRDTGAGSYLNIAMGVSPNEKRIYISDEDYEKAQELLREFIESTGIDEDNIEEMPEELKEDNETEEEKKNDIKKYNKSKYFLLAITFGFILICLIVCVITTIINN